MSTLKLRADQLNNLIEQITFEADDLADKLKRGLVPEPTASKLEEVLAHSLILISAIVFALVEGDIDTIKEMNKVAKGFLINLKDINQSINQDAVHK